MEWKKLYYKWVFLLRKISTAIVVHETPSGDDARWCYFCVFAIVKGSIFIKWLHDLLNHRILIEIKRLMKH